MIRKGPYTIFESNFILMNVPAYDFDEYARNVTLLSMANAALPAPVVSAVSTDMGRQVAANNAGELHMGTGFPLVVGQEWYNPTVQATEYFARQTCGHTPTKQQLTGRYATLAAAGFAASATKTEYIVTQGGVVCEDALPNVFTGSLQAQDLGMDFTSGVVTVSVDNEGGVSTGGTLAIAGNTATFTYFKKLDKLPILAVELSATGEFVAAVLATVGLDKATIEFRNQSNAAVTFPGGRLTVTGLMFI